MFKSKVQKAMSPIIQVILDDSQVNSGMELEKIVFFRGRKFKKQKAITFRCLSWGLAKTGNLICRQGWKVEVRLIKALESDSKEDWSHTWLGVVGGSVPFWGYDDTFQTVRGREIEPKIHAYIVSQRENAPNNLRVWKRLGGNLPADEPIVITYDKSIETVRFTSKTFEYYQTDLPSDVDFAVCAWMHAQVEGGIKMDVKIVSIF